MPDRNLLLTWLSLCCIALLYLVCALVILNPNVFGMGDHGVRLIEIKNLARQNLQSDAILYPGQAIDPEERFSPFIGTVFFYRGADQNVHGVYSLAFTLPASLLYRVWGITGAYVLIIGSTLGTLVLSSWTVTQLLGPKYVLASIWLLGIATPLFYYSVDLWDHSPTVLLVVITCALIVMLLYTGRTTPARMMLAGFTLGWAIWIRQELVLLAAALSIALVLTDWRKARSWALFLAAGASVPLGLFVVFNLVRSGSPIGSHFAQTQLDPTNFTSKLQAIIYLLPYSIPRWGLGFLVVTALTLILRIFHRRVTVAALALGGIAVILLANLLLDARDQRLAISLLDAFPLCLVVLLLAIPGVFRQMPSWARFSLFTMLILFTLVLVTGRHDGGPAQWGPRFLMAVFPLLVWLCLWMLKVFQEPHAISPELARAAHTFLVALALMSVLVQFRGVHVLNTKKIFYSKVLQTTKALPESVIVTDIWWFAHMMADAYGDKTMFLVDYRANGSMSELLPLLRDQGIQTIVFVSTSLDSVTKPGQMDALLQAAAAQGWRVQGTPQVFIDWLPLYFYTLQQE